MSDKDISSKEKSIIKDEVGKNDSIKVYLIIG